MLSHQITELCIYSDGSIDYNQAWAMSYSSREMAVKILNKRFKDQNPGGKDYM